MSSSEPSTGDSLSSSVASLVRPLGALERMFHRYDEINPSHHLLVAEFYTVLAEEQVIAALAAVQKRHPLLSVHLEDRPDSRLGFYRPASVPPIGLTVRHQEARSWQAVAAEELSHRFVASSGPLMRASLISDEHASTLLLAFDHVIADGISAVSMLSDLVAALNGKHLESLSTPLPAEDLLIQTFPQMSQLQPSPPPAGDPRMALPVAMRPFDQSVPEVRALELDAGLTARLVERCRMEHTTVQGLLVACTSRVRSALTGEEFVRTNTPINVRDLIGVGADIADYFAVARTGLAPFDGAALWDQARSVSAELAGRRSAAAVQAGSVAVQHFVPVDVEAKTVQEFMIDALGYEQQVSNLGVIEIPSAGPIHPTAVWAPLLLMQVSGETITGVATFEGRMRFVACAYAPADEFLAELEKALLDACV